MKKFTLIITFLAFCSSVQAQMSYGDRRIKADTDPRTLDARIEFNKAARRAFNQSIKVYGLEGMRLKLNPRIVSQYGRGKDSAMEVIPKEIDQILSLISEAKERPYQLADCLAQMREFDGHSQEALLEAAQKLGRTERIFIDYWGYTVQTEVPPVFDSSDRELTYKAHWHEADSYYELYSQEEARINIVLSVLNEKEKAWFEFW